MLSDFDNFLQEHTGGNFQQTLHMSVGPILS